MSKTEIKEYMKSELNDLWCKVVDASEEYDKAQGYIEECATGHELEKQRAIYYHFWMVCNDLGVIKKEDIKS